MHIKPYIFVDNCKEAMDYYKEIFRGEVKNVTLADGKAGFVGHEGKILHAQLQVGNNLIHFSDSFNDEMVQGNQMKILLEIEEEAEIKRIYEALKENSDIHIELQEMFWGATHASLTDYNGISWVLNYEHNK
ncbi:VOC family protein [Bacillus sp. JJ722]|uniref:VOC family protein n=1 Tax=Bacillus sp. JJ722 TaxID=3122973 RepID=UPI0030003218